MKTCPGSADLPRDQGQRNQATCVVRSVYMLGYSHSPEDHGRRRTGKKPRHFLKGFSRDSTNRGNLFWRIILKIGFQFFKTTGVAGNIIFIYQAFRNDGVHHRVQHRHIGIRTELQEMGRMPGQLRASWIRQNEFRAVLSRVFDERCRYRMIGNRIGANQENDIGIRHIGKGIRNRTRTDPFKQCTHRRGMAKTGTVIHVVAAESRSYQFLQKVRFFVAAFRTPISCQCTLSMIVPDFLQTRSSKIQGFIPFSFSEDISPVFGIQ